jgi:hypothetical protein
MRDTGESFGIKFHLQSSDGDSGFPGNCQIELTVILDNQNQLQMIYSAETDKATPMNLTNHTYWNLSGDCKKSALDHSLRLHCSHYTPVDDTQIPTGEIRAVKGSAFDLTTADMLGGHIDLVDGGGKPGFDHNFVADRKAHMDKDTLLVVAQLTEPESGRAMIIATTEPGLQVYTANFLDSESTEFPHVQVKLLTLQHRPQTLMMLVSTMQCVSSASTSQTVSTSRNFPQLCLFPGKSTTNTPCTAFTAFSLGCDQSATCGYKPINLTVALISVLSASRFSWSPQSVRYCSTSYRDPCTTACRRTIHLQEEK